ncbi:MAG: hypothetical protein ACKOOL_12755 [Novosphingobium sp.]
MLRPGEGVIAPQRATRPDNLGSVKNGTLARPGPTLLGRGPAPGDFGLLVMGKELVEIHKKAPACKREREGLSATGAYNYVARDGLDMGAFQPKSRNMAKIDHKGGRVIANPKIPMRRKLGFRDISCYMAWADVEFCDGLRKFDDRLLLKNEGANWTTTSFQLRPDALPARQFAVW